MTQPSEGLVAVAVLHISTGGIAEAAHEIASSAVPRKLLIYEFPLLTDFFPDDARGWLWPNTVELPSLRQGLQPRQPRWGGAA
ncbi:hypothetical protein [Variovorax gossypii]|uniref:hypothetical protein n=1 Tax=Variovorax gossypii TaxID=1679495 RepID=UPI001476CF3D|nr:hypothetical protein [Variovorax gossypii]